jgi:hypothetical protein
MKAPLAITLAVLSLPAIAQDAGMAGKSRVNAIYVEQAPGLLIETRIARGVTGSLVADVNETTPGGTVEKRLIRLPEGARVQVGQDMSAHSSVGSTARSNAKIVRVPVGSTGIDCIPYVAGR